MAADRTVTTEFRAIGTERASAQARAYADSIGKVGKAAGVGATALLSAGGAVGGLVDQVTGSIDKMNTLAEASGLSISVIKGLSIEAKRTGKDLEQLVPDKLALRLRQAQQGSKEARQALLDLGFSAEEVQAGLSADTAFPEIIERLQNMDDRSQRAAIAMQLLGRNGSQMLSAFGEGKASLEEVVRLGGQLGLDVGPEAVKATGDWQRATAKLGLAFETATAQIQPLIGPIAQKVTDFAVGTTFAFVAMSEVLGGSGFQAAINKATATAYELSQGLQETKDSIEETGDAAEDSGPPVDDLGKRLRGLGGAAAATLPELDSLRLRLAQLTGDELDSIAVQLDIDLAEVDSQLDDLRAALERAGDPGEIDKISTAIETLMALRIALIDDANKRFKEKTEEEARLAMKSSQAQMVILGQQMDAERQARRTAMEEAIAAEEEVRAARKETMLQSLSAAASYATAHGQLTDLVIGQLNTTSTEGRKTALALFRVNQGVAVSQIVVSTAVAIVRALADLGPIAGAIAAGAIGATGLAQSAIVLAERPKFHIGSRAADEVPAMLRTREVVMTPQGQELAGLRDRVASQNAGYQRPEMVVLQMPGSRFVDVGFLRSTRDPRSPVSRKLRAARSKPLGRI